jgi:hypothetical protein
MASQVLINQRHQFFSRCLNSLKKQLPRSYRPVPTLEQLANVGSGPSWVIFYEPADHVYFQWQFTKDSFTVNLVFETGDSNINRELLARFEPIKTRLESRLGCRLTFDDNWPRDGVIWTRLYVSNDEKQMTPDLEEWAVEKSKILIQQCEPLLKNRTADEPPSPAPDASDLGSPSPERVAVTVHRIIRDTELARHVKALHRQECQICGHTIELPDGSSYAEAHHIQPLGEPHNGPDVIGNILCVCPNHHAELDLRARKITKSELAIVDGHAVARKFVDYHNRKIYGQV